MFRAMKKSEDGYPTLGPSGRTVCVRTVGPVRDVPVAKDGSVGRNR
jgi:hypothetical protein